MADWLISQKAQVNAVDRFGFTPLESAVRGKHKELMKLLKTQGAKVMQVCAGWRALPASHQAACDLLNIRQHTQ